MEMPWAFAETTASGNAALILAATTCGSFRFGAPTWAGAAAGAMTAIVNTPYHRLYFSVGFGASAGLGGAAGLGVAGLASFFSSASFSAFSSSLDCTLVARAVSF